MYHSSPCWGLRKEGVLDLSRTCWKLISATWPPPRNFQNRHVQNFLGWFGSKLFSFRHAQISYISKTLGYISTCPHYMPLNHCIVIFTIFSMNFLVKLQTCHGTHVRKFTDKEDWYGASECQPHGQTCGETPSVGGVILSVEVILYLTYNADPPRMSVGLYKPHEYYSCIHHKP